MHKILSNKYGFFVRRAYTWGKRIIASPGLGHNMFDAAMIGHLVFQVLLDARIGYIVGIVSLRKDDDLKGSQTLLSVDNQLAWDLKPLKKRGI